MNEHGLDAMIYAWQVLKEKEENKMIGVYAGKLTNINIERKAFMGVEDTAVVKMEFESQDIRDYDKLTIRNDEYSVVRNKDIITTNDELLKLRDKVKRLTDELSLKGTAYGKLDEAYGILATDRNCWKSKTEKLEAELTEIKTARTLREAYIAGVEKGCESLREDRDRWKNRCNSVMTDISNTLSANGIELKVKDVLGDVNWKIEFDIPELNEAKKKIAELEKKVKVAESKETFWRDRKEEEEDYHHYWHYTFDRAVKQAAEKGVYIAIAGKDDDCNAGIVVVENKKTADLESQVVQMEDANQKLRKRISAADEELEAATKRGDYWKSKYDDLAEYWDNTYKDMVACGAKVGVKIEFKGDKSDSNAGFVYATNEKALEMAYELNNVRQKQDKKWQAMTEALKAKGVEVIYMGEEGGKPVIDVKIPEWETNKQCLKLKEDLNALKKEYGRVLSEFALCRKQVEYDHKKLEELKSKKVATCTLEAGADGKLTFIYTYLDGHNEAAHINCLCKNHVAFDAENISCGTVPKCKSCAHYMHNAKYAHDWCHKPVSKEGPGRIRKLNKEEAEGPACSDFKVRKE